MLKSEITTSQLFSIAFGAIIGVSWIMLVAIWIWQAGSIGAILAFVAGGMVMLVVAFSYADIGKAFPVTGGEVVYAYKNYNKTMSFAVGWVLLFLYASLTVFEAVSVSWVLSTIFPSLNESPILYQIAGSDIRLSDIIIGLVGIVFIGFINYRGAKSASSFQEISTYLLLFMSILFILAGLWQGKAENLIPYFSDGQNLGSNLLGFSAVLVTTPLFFAGFGAIPQALGESKLSGENTLKNLMLMVIAAAIIFYCGIIFAAAFLTPVADLMNEGLPAAKAFEIAFSSSLMAKAVLFAGLLGLITTWNATFFAATRVLYCLGNAKLISQRFGEVNENGSAPIFAVLFVSVFSIIGLFFGRSALLLLVSVGGICVSFVFMITCAGATKYFKALPLDSAPSNNKTIIQRCIFASVITLGLLIISIAQPTMSSGSLWNPEYIVMLCWIILGVVVWALSQSVRNSISDETRTKLILQG